MQDFLHSWWWAILCSTIFPVAWVLVKRFAAKTENKIDDEIVAAIDEAVLHKEAKQDEPGQPAQDPATDKGQQQNVYIQ